MAGRKNVVVAQSGGPTPVINNSLRGIIEACRSYPIEFGTIYAGYHGIEGILKEDLLDLSVQPEREIELLRTTPAAGSIGRADTSSRSRTKRISTALSRC